MIRFHTLRLFWYNVRHMDDLKTIDVGGAKGSEFVAALSKELRDEGGLCLLADSFDAEMFALRARAAEQGVVQPPQKMFSWTLLSSGVPVGRFRLSPDGSSAPDGWKAEDVASWFPAPPPSAAAPVAADSAVDVPSVGLGTKIGLFVFFMIPVVGFIWMCIRYKWI